MSWDDPFTRSSRVNPKGTAAKSGRAGRPLLSLSENAGMTLNERDCTI